MTARNTRSLLQYWAHPYLADETRQPLPVSEWLGWIGVMLVFSILGLGIARLAVHLLGHAWPVDRAIEQLVTHPSWGVVLFMICGPVLEELVFRAFMTRDTRIMSLGIGFAFATFGLFTLNALTHRHVSPQQNLDLRFFEGLAFVAAVALVIGLLAYGMRRVLQRGLVAAAPLWIVLMTLLFASAHALNFEQGWKPWLLWLTLPQLLIALVLVYLRVRNGLRWSIATHLVFDWLLIGTAWLHLGAKSAGAAGHAALVLMVFMVFGLFVYGVAYLFRRGVLRPLPVAA